MRGCVAYRVALHVSFCIRRSLFVFALYVSLHVLVCSCRVVVCVSPSCVVCECVGVRIHRCRRGSSPKF